MSWKPSWQTVRAALLVVFVAVSASVVSAAVTVETLNYHPNDLMTSGDFTRTYGLAGYNISKDAELTLYGYNKNTGSRSGDVEIDFYGPNGTKVGSYNIKFYLGGGVTSTSSCTTSVNASAMNLSEVAEMEAYFYTSTSSYTATEAECAIAL